jgi:hypothetical protein
MSAALKGIYIRGAPGLASRIFLSAASAARSAISFQTSAERKHRSRTFGSLVALAWPSASAILAR